MPTLRNSNISPSLVDDPIGRKEINEDGRRVERKELEKRYAIWKKFLDTDVGQACSRLVDPEIAHLNRLLSQSIAEVCRANQLSEKMVEEKRAEWRGQRRVWYRIKTEGPGLLARLNEIEGVDGKEEKGAVGWKPALKETKKNLDKS